jgi:tryptophan 2,3-dioxygenase
MDATMPDQGLTYGRYLRVPDLLELQKPASDPAHHDEPLFIVIHQVYELWFKLVLHELDSAVAHLDADRVGESTRLLRRVVEIQRLLIHQVRILETMRPQDFLGFRYHLNPASGFQSIQFREIEFLLGLKDEQMLGRVLCDPAEMERLRARLQAPSVRDTVDALLVRRGLLGPQNTRLEALALCEVLIEIDECLALWRAHHVQMVERMIGARRGTGGSEGVAYLQSTLPKRAFPDLWEVRSHIGQDPGPDAPTGCPVHR